MWSSSTKQLGRSGYFLHACCEFLLTGAVAVGDAVRVEPGSQLAGYRIERVLASGGTSTVYLVHDPVLPRLDALKVLNAELSSDDRARERFIHESDAGAGLHHPNIVSIYSRGEAQDGRLWIAMQYVAGTDAEAALASRTMTPPRALRIVSEVAKALDYAHQLNLVHLDVKPSNFLLSESSGGRDEHVLLSDFGISRTIGQSSNPTVDGPLALSLAYAAPEVITDSQVSSGADIYSLGCTLFRLLTGKHLFSRAEGTAELVQAHLTQMPPRVSDFMSGASPQLDAVIAKALAKNPIHRFGSAGEFSAAAAAALERVMPHSASGVTLSHQPAAQPARPAMDTRPAATPYWPPAPGPPAPPPWAQHAGWSPGFRPSARRRMLTKVRAHRRTLLAAAAGCAALALVIGIVVSTQRPTPAPATDVVSQPTQAPPAPTSAEPGAQARLIGLLPAGYPPGACTPSGVNSPTTAAALCGPNADPGGPSSATYTTLRDLPALRAAMDDVVHSATAVICPPNILSPGAWHRTETPSATVGIVFCGLRSGAPLVAWTNEDELLFSVTHSTAAGPPLDQLFTWWSTHS